MSERDKIVDELKWRLRYKFGQGVRIYASDGGVWGSWGRNLPCFHYYELPTEQKLHGQGLYDITFPIQIEYFARLTRKKDLFEEGREKLTEIQEGIELDERFGRHREVSSSSNVAAEHIRHLLGEDLCVHYFMKTTEITEILENILGVALLYEFRFVDAFLGYEKFRH